MKKVMDEEILDKEDIKEFNDCNFNSVSNFVGNLGGKSSFSWNDG